MSSALIGGVCTLAGLAVCAIPAVRRRVINTCLFPVGYSLYTSRTFGYTLHRAVFMSSSSKESSPPHSKVDAPVVDGEVSVELLPLFGDNYSYLLLHEGSKTMAIVDPADPAPVLKALEMHPEYKLHTILTTHKHWDHAGGNLELLKHFPSLQVVGGKGDGVAGATLEVGTGDVVHIGDAAPLTARVYQCPCHTRGHVVYSVGKLLFTGDTLFQGGCGRFFEGNGAEMYTNLLRTLGSLPDDTLVMCGHEYSQANLEFAQWVEPENEAIRDRLRWVEERRAGKWPTVPSTLGMERQINPFMRVHEAAVVSRVSRVMNLQQQGSGAAGATSEEQLGIQVMEALRTLKNDNAHKKK